jgi:hypothetical protein
MNEPVNSGCFGFCEACGITHSLSSQKAIAPALWLMDQIREHGRFDFDLPLTEANSLLSTEVLYTEMRGKMFGVLVCQDEGGNEVVLRAFSGKHNGVWNVSGWVPPLMDEQNFNATIELGNTEIHPLTDLVQGLEKGSPAWSRAVAERKIISQKVLVDLYALYEVHNFKNEKRTLAEAFRIKKGIPNGTGDCCAPKLLNFAAKNKLKPLSIAEFFWGKETASGHKTEGEFYPSCTDKCQPLLGFMLCGSDKP